LQYSRWISEGLTSGTWCSKTRCTYMQRQQGIKSNYNLFQDRSEHLQRKFLMSGAMRAEQNHWFQVERWWLNKTLTCHLHNNRICRIEGRSAHVSCQQLEFTKNERYLTNCCPCYQYQYDVKPYQQVQSNELIRPLNKKIATGLVSIG
jgi:hypothetical protein